MKKSLFILLASVLIASCDSKTEESKVVESTDTLSKVYDYSHVQKNLTGSTWENATIMYSHKEAGMRYDVYRFTTGGIAVVNVTKDSLQVEALKMALAIDVLK